VRAPFTSGCPTLNSLDTLKEAGRRFNVSPDMVRRMIAEKILRQVRSWQPRLGRFLRRRWIPSWSGSECALKRVIELPVREGTQRMSGNQCSQKVRKV